MVGSGAAEIFLPLRGGTPYKEAFLSNDGQNSKWPIGHLAPELGGQSENQVAKTGFLAQKKTLGTGPHGSLVE